MSYHNEVGHLAVIWRRGPEIWSPKRLAGLCDDMFSSQDSNLVSIGWLLIIRCTSSTTTSAEAWYSSSPRLVLLRPEYQPGQIVNHPGV